MLLQFKGDSLTSSEPSRQLSCPSQRRLADTQPPLVHTYSLTEQDGTTAEEKSVTGGFVRLWLVGDSSDLTECTLSYSQWTKRKCFFDLQKNNNYKLNSSHLQYKQCCGQQRLHKGGQLWFSVWWELSSPVSWQVFSSSPILQSSCPSHSHFIEMHRLLWQRNWSSEQCASQPFCN